MLGTLVKGRVSVAGCAGKATEKALTIAVRYGGERRQFAASGADAETVLLDHPAYRRTLLPAVARSYALHVAQEDLLVDLHDRLSAPEADEAAQRELESRAAGLKAVGTWHATDTVTACREACGGAGYLAENQLSGLRADLDVFTTFEGANTVLLQQSGKGLLTEYRQQIGDLDAVGMVSAVAEQILAVVGRKTSARSLVQRTRTLRGRAADRAAMRDHRWHRELFADRAEHVLRGLALRIQAGAKAGENEADLAARTQNHLLNAARVQLEKSMLESFVRAIGTVTDPALKSLLVSVCDLYVLSEIERDAAWFLEHGRLTGAQTKAATASVDLLCTELRPHARTLVDGFGVPEAWLTAPILRSPGGR